MNRRHWNLSRQRRLPTGLRGFWGGIGRAMLSRHSTPEAVALGIAIGCFVAFLPVLGFQMILAALLAACFKANAVVALGPVWITNPLTVMPIFVFTYRVGTFLIPGAGIEKFRAQFKPLMSRVDQQPAFAFWAQFREWARFSRDLFVPLLVGGILVGALCALVMYPVTLRVVRRIRTRRILARQARRQRRLLA